MFCIDDLNKMRYPLSTLHMWRCGSMRYIQIVLLLSYINELCPCDINKTVIQFRHLFITPSWWWNNVCGKASGCLLLVRYLWLKKYRTNFEINSFYTLSAISVDQVYILNKGYFYYYLCITYDVTFTKLCIMVCVECHWYYKIFDI